MSNIEKIIDKMKVQDYLDLPYSVIIKKITDESGTYYHAAV